MILELLGLDTSQGNLQMTMNEQARTQRQQFLNTTKNKLKIKLAIARTLNIETADEIETFTAAIAAIDLAIEAHEKSVL